MEKANRVDQKYQGPRPLVELEAIIERGLETFVDVGLALVEIRCRGLYRETHRSFDSYCRERWGWSKTHANRHIQAAEISALMTPIGVILPNEAVARELTPLLDEPEQISAVWKTIQGQHGPKPTAVEVRAVVGTIRPHTTRRSPPRDRGRTMDNLASSFENAAVLLTEVVSEMSEGDPRLPGWVTALRETRRAISSAIAVLERKEGS